MEIYINGVGLSALDSRIRIAAIAENAAKLTQNTAELPRGGTWVGDTKRSSLDIVASVGLFAPKHNERTELMNKVLSWANGGKELRLSYRQHQRLICRLSRLPQFQTDNWASDVDLTFTAYGCPFFEDEYPIAATLTGTSENGSLQLPGNADGAIVDCLVSNTSGGAVDTLRVECNDMKLEFAGLNLPSGKTLTISHDEFGILSVKTSDGLGKLSCRSGDDLLAAKAGGNTVRLTADRSVTAKFSARGLWL